MWPSCWLWGILIILGSFLSQLKPSDLYILSCEKGHGLLGVHMSDSKVAGYEELAVGLLVIIDHENIIFTIIKHCVQ